MRRRKHATNRPSETVHCTQARIGKGEAAEKAGNGHVLTSVRVRSVKVNSSQRPGGSLNAFQAKRVDHWIVASADVGFDQLRKGIETSGSGEARRQIQSEFRIDERDLRQHKRAAEAYLHFLVRGEDRVASDFRAGAGGSWNGYASGGRVFERLTFADNFKVIQ